jgi:hypothetical protein
VTALDGLSDEYAFDAIGALETVPAALRHSAALGTAHGAIAVIAAEHGAAEGVAAILALARQLQYWIDTELISD